jgi:signal recognition particle subunit SRP54
MIPGMPAGMMDGNEEDTSAKLKRMIFITDAMRADELDSDGLIFVSFSCLEQVVVPHQLIRLGVIR